jgi:hypothetical protein
MLRINLLKYLKLSSMAKLKCNFKNRFCASRFLRSLYNPFIRQNVPCTSSKKFLCPCCRLVSQPTPLSFIPFSIKALYPDHCYLNNGNNADHLLFSTTRKHFPLFSLSFGNVDIYFFRRIVRAYV